jgi:DNA-binding SARP family transcriptional activator
MVAVRAQWAQLTARRLPIGHDEVRSDRRIGAPQLCHTRLGLSAEVGMGEVEARALGELQVSRGGATVGEAQLPGHQARLVLAYLMAHRDRVVPAAELAGIVWPAHRPTGWESALSTVVSRLRSVLANLPGEPLIVSGRGRYRFEAPDRISIDLEQITEKLELARHALAQADPLAAADHAVKVIELADQPFLADQDSPWLDQQRDRLRAAWLAALAILTEARLAGGDPIAAVGHAERLVASDPLRETGYQLLINAHVAAGNRAEALRVYQRCRVALSTELGVDPSPQTEACYLAALRLEPPMPPGRGPFPAALAAHRRGPMIGRIDELIQLERTSRDAAQGQVHLVLVTGEPGIGKTRLVAEAAARAHQDGALVLFGRCDDEHTLPYQPFVEALRQLLATQPPAQLRTVLGVWAPDLARLLPELADRLPTLPPAINAEPDTQRYRLLEGVAAVLVGAARDSRLLLVLDDVQWADAPTLVMLRHLLRASVDSPPCVFATCRDGEIDAKHPLTALLADLRRDELVSTLPLRPLEVAEVARLLADRHQLAGQVHRLTAGNPFFVRQLIGHLDETGQDLDSAGIPQGVTDVVRRRLALLDATAQQLLIFASVAGSTFRLAVIAHAAGISEPDALSALEQASAARLVQERASGVFGFGHDLVRAALYEQLGPSRRTRLHRWIGEALEALSPESVGELAGHYHAAAVEADPAMASKAVSYALAAADRAIARLAYEDAARHCEHAAELAISAQRPQVLLALAGAYAKSGDSRATRMYLEASTAARMAGDNELLAAAALGAAATWGGTGIVDPARIELLEQALTAAGPHDSPTRARLLASLSGELYFGPHERRRDQLSDQAVGIARRLSDPATLGRCLDARNYATWGPGGAEHQLRTAREIIGLAQTADDPELALSGHAWGITATAALGDLTTFDEHLTAYSELAERLRQPRYRWYAQSRTAVRAQMVGDYDSAMRHARQGWQTARAAGEPDAHNVYNGNRLGIWFERPDATAAAEMDAQHATLETTLPPSNTSRTSVRAYTAYIHLLLDDQPTARALWRALTIDHLSALTRDFEWIDVMTSCAWLATRLRAREHAEAITAMLTPYARYAAIDSGAVLFLGSIHHTLGMLATTLGHWTKADQHLDAALDFHQRMGATPWTARTRYEQARLAYRRHRPTDADTALNHAMRIATQLGMARLARDITELTSTGCTL